MRNLIIESIKKLLEKYILSEQPTLERKLVLVYVKEKEGFYK